MRDAYKILVGNPKGKRPLGKPRHKWEDIVQTDFGETELQGVNWINLAQDRNQ
jgi:hypothetical protein